MGTYHQRYKPYHRRRLMNTQRRIRPNWTRLLLYIDSAHIPGQPAWIKERLNKDARQADVEDGGTGGFCRGRVVGTALLSQAPRGSDS